LALVVLKDKLVVLGPGFSLGAQVLVNIPVLLPLFKLFWTKPKLHNHVFWIQDWEGKSGS